jgi:hypothetical protein
MSLSEEERKAIVAYRIEKARTVIAEINPDRSLGFMA